MKLRYTLQGAAELDKVLAHIEERSPQGARHVQTRIQTIINLLLQHPHAGQLTSKGRLRRAMAVASAMGKQRSWAAKAASLRKRAVTPSLAFSGEMELHHTGRAYLAIAPPRKCAQRLLIIRNAFAARPVKNDIVAISLASDIQDESVWVRCYPSQIAQIVFTEPDHYPVLIRSINFSKTSRNIGSCVFSTWRWFQRPEPRTSGRSEECPNHPGDGRSRCVRA